MNRSLIKMQGYYKNPYFKCVISILAISIYKKYIYNVKTEYFRKICFENSFIKI